MLKRRKSLVTSRSRAFSAQNGDCYYCNQPMWKNDPSELTSKYGIALHQAMYLQCTGEHLVAHKDGGGTGEKNIVAACKFCNLQRHKRKDDVAPQQFLHLVQQRLSKGRWHGIRLIR